MGALTRPGGDPPLIDIPSPLHVNIERVLTKTVRDNQLESFYDAPKISLLARTLDRTVNYEELCARLDKPMTAALDLSALALYKIVFLCDNSSSMQKFPQRIDDLRAILSRTAETAALFDTAGVSVRFLNSTMHADAVKTAEDVTRLLAGVRYCGLTQLGTKFHAKIVDEYVNMFMEKPVLAFIITDGEPQGEDPGTLLQVIKNVKTTYGPERLAVQIAQVGSDAGAQAFLQTLDDDETVGAMIDCTSNFELEAEQWRKKGHDTDLNPESYYAKMWLGAINGEYDSLN